MNRAIIATLALAAAAFLSTMAHGHPHASHNPHSYREYGFATGKVFVGGSDDSRREMACDSALSVANEEADKFGASEHYAERADEQADGGCTCRSWKEGGEKGTVCAFAYWIFHSPEPDPYSTGGDGCLSPGHCL